MRLPFNGTYLLTQPFGVDQGFKYGIHEGVDYALPTGTPLFAAMTGTVFVAGDAGDAGKAVSIYNGNMRAKCFHMDSIRVQRNQWVNEGDLIGFSGNTGYSIGPHLHFQVEKDGQPVNPLNYIDEDKDMKVKNRHQGKLLYVLGQHREYNQVSDAEADGLIGRDVEEIFGQWVYGEKNPKDKIEWHTANFKLKNYDALAKKTNNPQLTTCTEEEINKVAKELQEAVSAVNELRR